ncbi:MAG: hypothetical protein J2P28_04285 [Actinobacteria bacterium]|nr:hypothetical protein [Actinomycetota bacterium]MBO0834726.1 hypothetical protein [Actinomycetota bacterium]
MTATAAVLLVATLAAGAGSTADEPAAAARAAGAIPKQAASSYPTAGLTAVRRGTITFGSGDTITLGSGPALPADPNADSYAYQACRDLRTPLGGTAVPTLYYQEPDPPAGSQQAPGKPKDFVQWGGFIVLALSPNEGASSYAAGWSNASKLAASALVPPVLTVADWRRTYPNPPLEPPPYGDPNTQGPSPTGIWQTSKTSPGGIWGAQLTPAGNNKVNYCQLLIGQLDDDPTAPFPPTNAEATFPPVKATFLAFGFEPVTATVHLDEQTTGGELIPVTEVAYQRYKHYNEATGDLISGKECEALEASKECGFNYCQSTSLTRQCSDYVVTVTAAVTLRLSDVTVNGTPLDVGSHCQTTGPLYTPDNPIADPGDDRVVLQGGSDPTSEPYPQWPLLSLTANILNGGAVAGYATIPQFTGCVTPSGDNLDPLLDTTVSGPGNYVKMTAGQVCSDLSGPACTNGKPPFLDPDARALPLAKIYR